MAWASHAKNETILRQGAIVDGVPWGHSNPPLAIVLSNACDLEHGKASFILVAALIEAQETFQKSKEFLTFFQGLPEGTTTLSKKKFDRLKDYAKRYINNAEITRYFFVDPNGVFDAPNLFIDFQKVTSVPLSSADSLQIIAEVQSPYIEKVIMHFSSYISRIGVDRQEDSVVDRAANEMIEPYTQAEN